LTGWIADLVGLIDSHPHWALLVVVLAAFGESLAVVGLVVPGALIMFAAGALVATGTLPFWTTAAGAAVGAVAGDGLSYWLGRRYRDQVVTLWPLRRHPDVLERARAFFQRHGGKSVALGRFVGPIRAVIPLVAGMLGMRPAAFYTANVLSAAAWAVAYLLPGVAFGASLALAGAVAGRLALLLGVTAVAAWLLLLGLRTGYGFALRHGDEWIARGRRTARVHPTLKWLLGDLLEPGGMPGRALVAWLLVLVASTWLFLGILEDVVTLDPLVRADQAVHHLLQGLRGPAADRMMILLSACGDAAVIVPVVIFAGAWMALRRAWRDLGYWLAAVVFGVAAVVLLKVGLRVPRPVEMYAGASAYSFPSGHATMSMIVYGLGALLAGAELPARRRLAGYGTALLLIAGIALSRLYLGVHWLSDVLAGLALGSAWVALLAMAHRRHAPQSLGRAFAPALAAVTLGAVAAHAAAQLPADLARYAPQPRVATMTESAWWSGAWRHLPARRIDLEGESEEPLNIQWAGRLSAIRARLQRLDWTHPVPLDVANTLRWLMPDPDIRQLPVPPRSHDGRYEALRLVRTTDDGTTFVLRLWPADLELMPAGEPLWVGTVAPLRLRDLLLLRIPVSADARATRADAGAGLLPSSCALRRRSAGSDGGTAPSTPTRLCQTGGTGSSERAPAESGAE